MTLPFGALPLDLVEAAPDRQCAACALDRQLVRVNALDFDVLSKDRFYSAVQRFTECGESHVVHFLAAHPTVVAREEPNYRALLQSGDLAVSDGTPIALAMWLQDRHARRLTSTEAFLHVCDQGVAAGTRHYFVGGADANVGAAIRSNLKQSFPGIEIVGFEIPPFRAYTEEELAALSTNIRDARADVVWVGIGAPKQEVLAHQLRMAGVAPVIATIGATFDFVAGSKPRAPRLMRKLGLEWLFRLVLEPRRLWHRYLVGNTRFLLGVAADHLRRQ